MEERMNEDDGDIEMQIDSDDDSDDDPHIIKLSTMENRIGQPSSLLYSQSKKDNIQVQDMDEESSDDEGISSAAKHQPSVAPMLPPTHDKVVIKKYDPKQVQKPISKPQPTDEYLISPITGERIPASKVAEHMRIGLLDPRWVEQRDKHTVDRLNQDNVSLLVAFTQTPSNVNHDRLIRFIGVRNWHCYRGQFETIGRKTYGYLRCW